ncbi:c-type cytochrome [Nitratifractor salsuginis]|uniref:Cytochrome c class I n=1 Tax=Nitratifractor salsuginis (strain DSM 16511 / JCM 12458 / E9I37-1) TaxID=749222 RepID=E6X237_NITSE|nr:c-type cytochrome [Nitratifractor salsuginis]ADV47106.1 cytochrome c class I [Nitratifractor salsuginis DSM 16511]
MRDLKVLAVVVFFTLVTYWGVEPYAHSVMHKHVEFEGFKYKDLKTPPKGDPAKGKALIATCTSCHGIKSQGMKAPMDPVSASAAYGVNPPDLSNAGAVLDEKFLANFIVSPTHAGLVKKSGMPGGMADAQGAADIAAYLKSIAPKEVKPQEAFEFACGRCHAMRYAKWTQIGFVPKTKADIKTGVDLAKLDFEKKVGQYQLNLAKYLGKLPPDLSIIVRARGEHYLKTFVENPQNLLHGTAMPRVGVNNEGYEKVYKYLEEVGDPSKPKREKVGPWVLGYFVLFAFLAYLWYKSQWKDLH